LRGEGQGEGRAKRLAVNKSKALVNPVFP